MIRCQPTKNGTVKVTFSLPAEQAGGKVSVVGDFNGWDPHATPLRKRSGLLTASVSLPAGQRHAFRYLVEGGQWLDDDEAHDREINEFGTKNNVIDVG
ncbi:MAG: isoamylase early set domain-containing protein [Acidimicrobiales bacterium]